MLTRAPSLDDTTFTHRSLAPAHARLAAHDDAIVRSQITVAQIAAPTGEEHERGGWIARRFRDCGLSDIHTDGAGNVIGRRDGASEQLPPDPDTGSVRIDLRIGVREELDQDRRRQGLVPDGAVPRAA